tara:strand:+ start:683 stop:928 length:246 start_codon:yes stop_codon:yes gene_type:complete
MGKHLDITMDFNFPDIDLGNRCTSCGKDTSFGTGLFVNRIPSDADAELVLSGKTYHVTVEGYMCIECQTSCEKTKKEQENN